MTREPIDLTRYPYVLPAFDAQAFKWGIATGFVVGLLVAVIVVWASVEAFS